MITVSRKRETGGSESSAHEQKLSKDKPVQLTLKMVKMPGPRTEASLQAKKTAWEHLGPSQGHYLGDF